jgi:hypothetical protein
MLPRSRSRKGCRRNAPSEAQGVQDEPAAIQSSAQPLELVNPPIHSVCRFLISRSFELCPYVSNNRVVDDLRPTRVHRRTVVDAQVVDPSGCARTSADPSTRSPRRLAQLAEQLRALGTEWGDSRPPRFNRKTRRSESRRPARVSNVLDCLACPKAPPPAWLRSHRRRKSVDRGYSGRTRHRRAPALSCIRQHCGGSAKASATPS